MTSYKWGADSRTRMETMVRTNDGFEISEVDMQLRGPGDIEGTQQSGILDLRIADLARDQAILQIARNAAQDLIDEDPNLEKEENKSIKLFLEQKEKNRMNWSKVA